MYPYARFIEICPIKGRFKNKSALVQITAVRQAILWINDVLFYRCIYALLSLMELMISDIISDQ